MTTVRDNPDEQRYEIVRDDAVLGFAAYRRADDLVVFTHTEVDPSVEGEGVGSQLVRGALDHVRSLGLSVRPDCPFVESWMASHPDYLDLDSRRSPGDAGD